MSGGGVTTVAWNDVARASMDGLGVTREGTFVRANDALASVFDFEDSETLVGTPWRECYPPVEHERIAQIVSDVRQGEPWRGRVMGPSTDGSQEARKLSLRRLDDSDDVIWVVRDVDERVERERALDRYETLVETVDDGVYAIDETLAFSFVNEGLCEMIGRSKEDVLGTPVGEFFLYDEEYAVAADMRERVLNGDTSVGSVEGTVPVDGRPRHIEARYRLHPDPDEGFRGSVGVLRDVTERVERERELATLNRINGLLLDIVREAVRTPTRDAVEGTVCERLGASDRYELAWIGERELDGPDVVARTASGADDGRLESLSVAVDGDSPNPIGRALETGAVQVATLTAADGVPWADEAVDGPSQSVVAVPIRHEGTVYATLVVHASGPDAVTQRERDGFAILGETIGFVVNALKRRRLLFADTVVELEFDVSGESLLFRTARDLDCTISLVGFADTGSTLLLYVDVDDASSEAFVSVVSEDPAVARARAIDGDGEHERVELVLTRSSLVDTVLSAGATLESAVIEPSGARLALEAPAETDVRDVVAHVQAGFERVDLVARRQHDRTAATGGPSDSLLSGLTDRQQLALEVAYHAGYFEWPRTSTAEEVAASMDISAPTLHYHLRNGESRILSGLFE